MEPTTGQLVAVGALVLAAVVVGWAFAADLGSSAPEPVPFEDTVKQGTTAESEQVARSRGASIPRAEVFYSQYRYVVGYGGIDHAVDALGKPGHEQQFGYPLAVYVSDYEKTNVQCGPDGYLQTPVPPDWVPATDAHYVVDSDARVPGGAAVVPFGSVGDARAFADRCGGTVVGWTDVQERQWEVDQVGATREQVAPRHERATAQVRAVRSFRDRPVSVVVGRDEPTLAAAVAAAPPNTTVRLPPGTYDGNVTVEKPLTIHGEDARLDGNGTGTVLTVEADDVAVVAVDIVGVGNRTLGSPSADDSDAWDATVQRAYGRSDAGVRAVNVSRVYVADVTIDTPSSGVVLLRTPGAVVENVTVNGSEEWRDGFMGVIAMHEGVVVQRSTFDGGRDGIYLHRAHGTVVRDNTFYDNRFGTHLMYTSRALVADNVARGQLYSGVVIMTNPTGNAVVGNDIRHSGSGILTAGSHTYVAHNVVVDTGRGLSTNAAQSLYEHNVLYGNRIGLAASTAVPSNTVVANDFVDNERHAISGPGPLRIYTEDGRGNYWSGAFELRATGTGPTLSRPYSPTDAVDSQLDRSDSAVVLASAPGVRGLRALRGTTPGFRSASIIDTAPLRAPANPALVASARNETAADTAAELTQTETSDDD